MKHVYNNTVTHSAQILYFKLTDWNNPFVPGTFHIILLFGSLPSFIYCTHEYIMYIISSIFVIRLLNGIYIYIYIYLHFLI